MNKIQEYKLSLFERCEAGDITKEERNLLLEAVSEEEVETEMEESEENIEEELDKYAESILGRFEEGILTKEEVEILLESTRYMREINKKYNKAVQDEKKYKKMGDMNDNTYDKLGPDAWSKRDDYYLKKELRASRKKDKYTNSLSQGKKVAKAIKDGSYESSIKRKINDGITKKHEIRRKLNIENEPVLRYTPYGLRLV